DVERLEEAVVEHRLRVEVAQAVDVHVNAIVVDDCHGTATETQVIQQPFLNPSRYAVLQASSGGREGESSRIRRCSTWRNAACQRRASASVRPLRRSVCARLPTP